MVDFMFCPNCGNPVDDNAAFCNGCGTKLTVQTKEIAEQETQSPVQTDTAATQEVCVDSTVVPKKNLKKKPLIISVVAVVLAVAIAIPFFVFGNKDKGGNDVMASAVDMINTFNDGDASLTAKAKSVSNLLYSTTNNSIGKKVTLKLNASDSAIDIIEELAGDSMGQPIDLSWIANTEMGVEFNFKDNMMQLLGDLSIDGKELIDFDSIIDMNNYEMFFGLPSLSSTYLFTTLPNNASEGSSMSFEIMESLMSDEGNLMPTEEEVNSLLERYIGIVDENLKISNGTETTITVDGIIQDVTLYTIDISQKDIYNIVLEILKTAKNDKELQEIISRFASFLANQGIITDTEASEVMDSYASGIADTISEGEETIAYASEKVILTIERYVDSDNNIIGRDFIVNGSSVLYHATATKDGNYASTFEADGFKLAGRGTVENDKKTGTYTIYDGNYDLFSFRIKDFCLNKYGPNGSVLFDLPEEALDSIPSELSFIVSGMSELEIKFTSSSSAFSVEANLLLNNEVFVGLCVAIEDSSAQSISAPTNTISADSRNAMLEWASTADWDKFIKNLKDSPLGDIVPEETWEQLEQNLPAA